MQHGTEGRPRKAAGPDNRKGGPDNMTEKQLEDLGYNQAAIAAILEMIKELKEA